LLNTSTKLGTLKLDFFSYLKALFNLMKPRVMSLVIFTCVVGLLIAPIKVNFLNAIFSILAVALGSGAAGALNMWYEADLDSIMRMYLVKCSLKSIIRLTYISLSMPVVL